MQPPGSPSWPSEPPLTPPQSPPGTPGPQADDGEPDAIASNTPRSAIASNTPRSAIASNTPRSAIASNTPRSAIASVIGILAGLVLATANLAGWADSAAGADSTWEEATVLDGETGGLSGLIEDQLTDALSSTLDIEGLVDDALPGPLGSLGQPAEGLFGGMLDEVVDGAVGGVLDQPLVRDLIAGYEDDLDAELVDLVRSESDWVHLDDDNVILDLAPALEAAARRLDGWGLGVLGDELTDRDLEVSLGAMPSVTAAADSMDELERLARILPLVGLALAVGALALASDRSRLLTILGVVLAAASLVLVAAELAGAGPMSGPTAPIEELTGSSLQDVATGPLVVRSLGLAALGIGLAIAGWFHTHRRPAADAALAESR